MRGAGQKRSMQPKKKVNRGDEGMFFFRLGEKGFSCQGGRLAEVLEGC